MSTVPSPGQPADGPSTGRQPIESRPVASPSSVRAQLLATEHWSLLATRSMTQSEILARISMFLTLVSASIVSLALIGQVTQFDPRFLTFALVLIGAVFVVGVLTQMGGRRTTIWWVPIRESSCSPAAERSSRFSMPVSPASSARLSPAAATAPFRSSPQRPLFARACSSARRYCSVCGNSRGCVSVTCHSSHRFSSETCRGPGAVVLTPCMRHKTIVRAWAVSGR